MDTNNQPRGHGVAVEPDVVPSKVPRVPSSRSSRSRPSSRRSSSGCSSGPWRAVRTRRTGRDRRGRARAARGRHAAGAPAPDPPGRELAAVPQRPRRAVVDLRLDGSLRRRRAHSRRRAMRSILQRGVGPLPAVARGDSPAPVVRHRGGGSREARARRHPERAWICRGGPVDLAAAATCADDGTRRPAVHGAAAGRDRAGGRDAGSHCGDRHRPALEREPAARRCPSATRSAARSRLADYFGQAAGRARARLLQLSDALHAGVQRPGGALSVMSLEAGPRLRRRGRQLRPRERPADGGREEERVPEPRTSGPAAARAGTS